jgi:hypothetical protein
MPKPLNTGTKKQSGSKQNKMMFSDQEILNLCEALKEFKSPIYTHSLEDALQKRENAAGNKQEEMSLRCFREVISRFLIDMYDMLDRVSKDLPNTNDIDRYWNSVRQQMEKTMESWANEQASESDTLKPHIKQILSDLREFHDRAVKFHSERQKFSMSLRESSSNEKI